MERIDSAHNLNIWITALQWLGYTLSVLLIFSIALPEIRNRVIHPENIRILKRLKEVRSQIGQRVPLQKIINGEILFSKK